MDNILLEIQELKKYFLIRKGLFKRNPSYILKAVDGVSLKIVKGETLGLAGESGCGKTTLGKTAIRLYEPTAGSILFEGHDITRMPGGSLKKFRKDAQIVFQDPFGSLDPKMKIINILKEPLVVHSVPREEMDEMVVSILEKVGLGSEHLYKYPYQFSGGQRQRISIARALILKPKFLVADEPVSALDVSIQAQILLLFKEIKEEMNLTYLFISHDLAVIKLVCDRVGIMYMGKLVEMADTNVLYDYPLHPYTDTLISACPVPDPGSKKDYELSLDEVPSPLRPPKGCRFHPRCKRRLEICDRSEPIFWEYKNNHFIACHLYSS